jgi:hypothetical protein
MSLPPKCGGLGFRDESISREIEPKETAPTSSGRHLLRPLSDYAETSSSTLTGDPFSGLRKITPSFSS